jgi:hypothetical protein
VLKTVGAAAAAVDKVRDAAGDRPAREGAVSGDASDSSHRHSRPRPEGAARWA